MATVPFSIRLKQSIIQTACLPFTNKKREIIDNIQNDTKLLELMCIAEASREETMLARQLPGIWFDKPNLDVYIDHEKMNINILVAKTHGYPANGRDTIYIKRTKSKAAIFAYLDAALIPWFRADDDQTALTVALTTLMDNCTTLNMAAKVMPNIIVWCDEDVRQKLNAANTRNKKPIMTAEEIMAEAFDENAIAAAARSRVL